MRVQVLPLPETVLSLRGTHFFLPVKGNDWERSSKSEDNEENGEDDDNNKRNKNKNKKKKKKKHKNSGKKRQEATRSKTKRQEAAKKRTTKGKNTLLRTANETNKQRNKETRERKKERKNERTKERKKETNKQTSKQTPTNQQPTNNPRFDCKSIGRRSMVNNSSPALFLGKGSEWGLVDLTQQEENRNRTEKHLADKNNIAKTSKATHTGYRICSQDRRNENRQRFFSQDPRPGGFNPSNLDCRYSTGKDRERGHVSRTDWNHQRREKRLLWSSHIPHNSSHLFSSIWVNSNFVIC